MCFVDSLDIHASTCMSPAFNGSSAIRHFKHSNAIKIPDGITIDFYTGLPHMYRVTAWTHKLHYIPPVAQLPLNLITLTLFWFLITGSSSIQVKKTSFVPRPSHHPVSDCLQYCIAGNFREVQIFTIFATHDQKRENKNREIQNRENLNR